MNRNRAWLILIAGIVLFVVFELREEPGKPLSKIALELAEDVPLILMSAGAALLLAFGGRRGD
ncbi:MAG TPA: hypothetical protein VIA45_17385 [Thermoanaerobaculia bacterium]|jgi:hypothetical protein